MMGVHKQTEYPAPVGQLSLWIGMLGGPAVWFMHLVAAYVLVPAACAAGLTPALYLVIPIGIGLGLIPLVLAWRGWQATRDMPDVNGNDQRFVYNRVRFMAVSGLVLSVLFLMVIIAQSMPIIVQNPCESGGSIRI